MPKLMEFMCQCGMVIQVPRSQAGKTVSCARCHSLLQIPVGDNEESNWQEGASATAYPGMQPGMQPWQQGMAPQQQPVYNANPPAYNVGIPPQPAVLCSACGEHNPFASQTCLHCGHPLSIYEQAQAMPGQMPAKSGGASNQPKPKGTRRIKKRGRMLAFFFSIFFLVLGISMGLMLCPGYLDIIPAGSSLLPALFPKKYSHMGDTFLSFQKELANFTSPEMRSKLGDMQPWIDKFDGYASRIKQARKELFSLIQNGKSIEDWQKKVATPEAQILSLWKKEGKWNIPLEEELVKLRQTREFVAKDQKSQSFEKESKEISDILEAAYRKCETSYKKMDNALADFRVFK